MALVIAQQPDSGKLMAAYNPIPFVVYANQPSSGDPCPVVYADIYFNNIYYGTISSTIYYAIVGPYAEYHFDIQDKCQEFLRSQLLVGIGPSQGNGRLDKHSTNCNVNFRETDIDTDGFTQSVGTAPIQGTFFEDPVSGDGEPSNIFYVLNAHLKQEDSDDLLTHIKKYTPATYTLTDIGYNLSHRPNEVQLWGALIGGGKYWLCEDDIDILSFCYTDDLVSSIVGHLAVEIEYMSGTSAIDIIGFASMPLPFPTANLTDVTYYLNAGIPNLKALLPALSWSNIKKYTVYLFAPFVDIATQAYYVKQDGSKSTRIRIFFASLLGGFDAINFHLTEEISKATSTSYQKSKDYIFPNKRGRGTGRFQPQQSDYIECWNEDYTEQDMPWIKELIGSAQAYVQVNPDTLQLETEQFFPIEILPSEFVAKKKDDAFVYNVAIKFKYSNEVINLRS